MQQTTNTLENHWMPFTANRDFKAEPRLVVKGEGVYYWNHKGDRVLDGTAGLSARPSAMAARRSSTPSIVSCSSSTSARRSTSAIRPPSSWRHASPR